MGITKVLKRRLSKIPGRFQRAFKSFQHPGGGARLQGLQRLQGFRGRGLCRKFHGALLKPLQTPYNISLQTPEFP